MAKDKEEVVDGADEAPKGKGKKKLIIILVSAVLLVVVLVVAFLVLFPKPDTAKGENPAMVEEDKTPPVYENLEPFTVNLADRETYLRVEIKLRMANPEVQEKLKEFMPDVRNDILNLLSSKQPDELSTPEGKIKLASDIQADINGLLKVKPDQGVKKVLFGDFLIQ
jgi:flagellar FliL protein